VHVSVKPVQIFQSLLVLRRKCPLNFSVKGGIFRGQGLEQLFLNFFNAVYHVLFFL
jgi:hypothetical protein